MTRGATNPRVRHPGLEPGSSFFLKQRLLLAGIAFGRSLFDRIRPRPWQVEPTRRTAIFHVREHLFFRARVHLYASQFHSAQGCLLQAIGAVRAVAGQLW